MHTLADLVNRATEPPPAATSTGFAQLDEATVGGFRPGESWLVTGAPGQGRSTLLLQWAVVLARTGKRVEVRAPLEDARDCVLRMIAREGTLSLGDLRHARLTPDRLPRLAEVCDDLASLSLTLSTEPIGSSNDFADIGARDAPDAYVLDDLHTYEGETTNDRLVARARSARALVLASLPRDVVVPDRRADGDLDALWASVFDVIVDVRHRGLDVSPGEAKLSLLRNRRGPALTATVGAQLHDGRFVDFTDRSTR